MHRFKLLSALLLITLATLAIACGDDDDGDDTGATDGATATATASPGDNGETPANGDDDDGVDETSPPDDKTPIAGDNGDDDDGNGGPSGETTDATPAPEGIPAVHIPNIAEWLSQNYPDVSPTETDCTYNPATVIATCNDTDYAVDPPLTGQDVACFALNVNSEPVAIRCTSQEPLTTIYYEIQG